MTEASAPRALAAVKGYAAAVAKARRAPQPSTVSLEALKEAGAALSEIRGLEGPEEKRGPRGEAEDGTAAAGAVEEAGPTAASDQAHLEWQMRRAVLFLRRKRWPLEAKTEATIEAQETAACNAICGTALVQMTVDELPAPKADDDDAAWELEVLQGLEASEGAATTTDDMGRKRARLRLAMGLARGHTKFTHVETQLRRWATTNTYAGRRGEVPCEGTWGVAPKLRLSTCKPFRTFYAESRNLQDCARALGMGSQYALEQWVGGLPHSFHGVTPLAVTNLDRPRDALRSATHSFVKRTFPREIGNVRGILSILTFARGHAVAIAFDVLGVPVFMTPPHPCPATAFDSGIAALTDAHGWARLGPGELLVTGHGKQALVAPCVLELPTDWHRFMCEPAATSLEDITSFVNTQTLDVTPAGGDSFVALQLLVACVALHARAFRIRWERIRL